MFPHGGIRQRRGRARLARSELKTARVGHPRDVGFSSRHRKPRAVRVKLVSLASLVALLVTAASVAAQTYQARPALVGGLIGPLRSATGRLVSSRRPIQGDTLITSSGSWSGKVTSYRYQWRDCNTGGTSCARIPGATSPRYTVQASDIGYALDSRVTACNSSCSSGVSAPTAVVTSTSGTTNPSGASVPPARVKDSFGTIWKREGYDNFTVNAALGSWATSTIRAIVYKGDGGLKWQEVADGAPCHPPAGYFAHCYEPSRVLSVHNGELDFYLHDCTYSGGFVGACGAAPGPLMPSTGTPYQTYGRYMVRIKLVYNDSAKLDQYHAAWMLWPKNGADHACAESDYPEWTLNSSLVHAFAHWGCNGSFDWYNVTTNMTKWHTLTQEWGPGFRRYYFDGKLLGQSRHEVYSGPERWRLQIEARNKPGDRTSGHVLVDWVWLGVRG